MSSVRETLILVSNQKTPDEYLAKTYPVLDRNQSTGKIRQYRTPVYKIFIKGTDAAGKPVVKEWTGLRFMPYWNDPKRPDGRYKTLGWVNSGKHRVTRQPVTHYNREYPIHNRISPFHGAITIDGSFLLHAGPADLNDTQWGAAGCVEMIGDFDAFKNDIKTVSGATAANLDDAIMETIHALKLLIEIEYAEPPDFKTKLDSEADPRP
jgi:hypothetical protein